MALGLPTGGVPPAAQADPHRLKTDEGDDDGIDDDEYTAPPNPTQAHLAELAQIEARTELLRAQMAKTDRPVGIGHRRYHTQRPLAEVALHDTQQWHRSSPFFNAAATALGLDDEQLDALFLAASKIEL